MSVQVHHSAAELARRKEQAHARVKRLRSIARHLSNAPIRETGSELERVRRRRAGMVAKLQELALRAEQGDWDEDPVRLASALDAVLDEALSAFQRNDTQQGIDLVVASTSTVDALLELLGGTDADDPGSTNSSSASGATRSTALDGATWQHPREGYRSMGTRMVQRAEGDDLPTRPVLEGDFAVFNEWTEILDMWEGNFMERIAPGAFTRTFKEDRDNIRLLFQHGRDAMLGSKVIGSIETLEETKRAAHYVAPLFRGLPELLLEGLGAEPSQYGASFRFEPLAETWVDQPKPSDYNPRGIPERTLTEVRVAEFGPVTFPAYTSASAALRSRSLTSKFGLVVPAGRSRAGSADGGAPTGATSRTLSQADPSARDRELRLRGIIK